MEPEIFRGSGTPSFGVIDIMVVSYGLYALSPYYSFAPKLFLYYVHRTRKKTQYLALALTTLKTPGKFCDSSHFMGLTPKMNSPLVVWQVEQVFTDLDFIMERLCSQMTYNVLTSVRYQKHETVKINHSLRLASFNHV